MPKVDLSMPRLAELAERLYRWRGREFMGAKDVLVWRKGEERIGVAFVGSPRKLLRLAVGKSLNNHHHYLDLGLQQALGMPAETYVSSGRLYAKYQTMDEGSSHISSVLSGVEALSSLFLTDDPEGVRVDATLMPDSGSPWWPGDKKTVWYSSKMGEQETTKPLWLVGVKERESGKEHPGADVCTVAEKMNGGGSKAVVAVVGGIPMLVTHSLSTDLRKEAAAMVKACGGLLFPSMAVSLVPASNFGHLVLVADPMVALQGIRPYRGRGSWPVTVYASDAWTENTTYIVNQASRELFDELTGNTFSTDWIYKSWLWVLGPPLQEGRVSPFGIEAKALVSTKALLQQLKNRAKAYPRELDKAGLEAARVAGTPYPFMEAKANLIVAPSCFNLAVCERKDAATSRKWLDAAGFEEVKLLAVKAPPTSEGRHDDWDYAWTVRDVLLEYADQGPGRKIGVKLV